MISLNDAGGRTRPIRVLIAEDSATARRLLVSIFSAEPDFEVIGEATTGAEAVEQTIEQSPDLVTMDIHMPVLDGLDATKEIMREAPTPILIVTSAAIHDVQLSLNALQAGALMVLEKPHGPHAPGFDFQRDQLLSMARAMADVKVVRRWGAGSGSFAPVKRTPVSRERSAQPARAIAIAASTGGPAAVRKLLLTLPRDLPVPVFLVQHISNGFVGGLVSWLDTDCPLRVVMAIDRDTPVAGTVYVAPDDRHLTVGADERMKLIDAAPVQGFRPSADVLFDSAGRAYGSRLVAVTLTGMGRDGVDGLKTVHKNGGFVIAQDEDSSVVFGMAKEAVEAGVVDEVLPVERIAERLVSLVRRT